MSHQLFSSEGRIYKTENLGEILRGDRISNTAYKIKVCQIQPHDILKAYYIKCQKIRGRIYKE